MSQTHIQTWSGTHGVNIIEMTNSGKSGKTCRQFRFWGDDRGSETMQGFFYARNLLKGESSGIVDVSYDEIVARLNDIITNAAFAESPYRLQGEEDTIRGVDAPLPVLSFICDGFALSVDKDGVHVSDLRDQHNLPRICTIRQKGRIAYGKAAKVWASLVACTTFSDVWTMLDDAGCRTHYWCAMD